MYKMDKQLREVYDSRPKDDILVLIPSQDNKHMALCVQLKEKYKILAVAAVNGHNLKAVRIASNTDDLGFIPLTNTVKQ